MLLIGSSVAILTFVVISAILQQKLSGSVKPQRASHSGVVTLRNFAGPQASKMHVLFPFTGKIPDFLHGNADGYLPNPQLGNVQFSHPRHNPPSPMAAISSRVTGTPAAIRGRIRSKMVVLAYITQPGRPMTGVPSS